MVGQHGVCFAATHVLDIHTSIQPLTLVLSHAATHYHHAMCLSSCSCLPSPFTGHRPHHAGAEPQVQQVRPRHLQHLSGGSQSQTHTTYHQLLLLLLQIKLLPPPSLYSLPHIHSICPCHLNTYQTYLKDSHTRLLEDMERARREGYMFAAKLVRWTGGV